MRGNRWSQTNSKKTAHDANMPDATEKATEMVFLIIENIDETKAKLLECPPPK